MNADVASTEVSAMLNSDFFMLISLNYYKVVNLSSVLQRWCPNDKFLLNSNNYHY